MIITIETTIHAPITKTWTAWTKPEHITHWNFASEDWSCPNAINEFEPGKEFNYRMEAKDGTIGFDFTGTYDQIIENSLITYTLEDGRKVEIRFIEENGIVKLIESFEAEGTNSDEMQKNGWQAILNNFKKYVETNERIQ